MKSRCCAWILCVALGIAALTGCGAYSTTETKEARKESGEGMVFDESATFGQINKMDGNTITIELGTQKKFEKENQDNGNQPNEKEQNGERPSMIDLTGEEQEIYVTDSTTITRQSMGKQRDKDNMNPSENTSQSEVEIKPEESDDKGQNTPPEGRQPEDISVMGNRRQILFLVLHLVRVQNLYRNIFGKGCVSWLVVVSAPETIRIKMEKRFIQPMSLWRNMNLHRIRRAILLRSRKKIPEPIRMDL